MNGQDYYPYPTPNNQLARQEAKPDMIFHYYLQVFDGGKYIQSKNRNTPVTDYLLLNPEQLNTDQWIKAAKIPEAKFVILTATHKTGFSLYQSDVNPYCLNAVQRRNGHDILLKILLICTENIA